MKNEMMLDAIGRIDDELILGAANDAPKKRTPARLKWGGIAACLCLCALLGIGAWHSGISNSTVDGGSGVDGTTPGGSTSDGIDPIMASVAIFPAGESLADVAEATCVSIDEEAARSAEGLGDYLPSSLPEVYRYDTASYYETVMKNGARYRMLRATYGSGSVAPAAPVPEDSQSTPAEVSSRAFLWMIWGHRPDTDRPVYRPEEITVQLLEQIDGGVFYIDYDGVYVGISQADISTEALLNVIGSIG